MRKNFENNLKCFRTSAVESRKEFLIKKIGILAENHFTLLPEFSALFRKVFNVHYKDIKVLCFNEEECDDRSMSFFNGKNFGWFGKIKNPELTDFINAPFDVLINYGLSDNLYMDIVTLQSKARFKAGYAKREPKLFDFMVATECNDPKILTDETVKYLKILTNKI